VLYCGKLFGRGIGNADPSVLVEESTCVFPSERLNRIVGTICRRRFTHHVMRRDRGRVLKHQARTDLWKPSTKFISLHISVG
jgi:hypothetical protein